MPLAHIYLRPLPSYRREMFEAGFEAAGYEIARGHMLGRPSPGDVLLVWNRRPNEEFLIHPFERARLPVVVAENGYIGSGPGEEKLFALALGGHNGSGHVPPGTTNRWPLMGVTLQPWRTCGDHLLVLPQRGIGSRGTAMPHEWGRQIESRLRAVTSRPIRIRRHPGTAPAASSLEEDLRGAWAAVTWGSGAAIKALALGVPVFYELKTWIGRRAAVLGIGDIEHPFLGDRLPMFESLAWAQWRVPEIASGEALRWLLSIRT